MFSRTHYAWIHRLRECDLHRACALCLMARCWLIWTINESTQALLSILPVFNNIHAITPVLMPDLAIENDVCSHISHCNLSIRRYVMSKPENQFVSWRRSRSRYVALNAALDHIYTDAFQHQQTEGGEHNPENKKTTVCELWALYTSITH